jgi:CheY-like chemotaxis protein
MNDISTLLVVEDDFDLREVVTLSLARTGLRVVEAENGREALDYVLAHGVPDLILLDMNMPVMNGWDFARELRERGLWGAPVIILTAAHDASRFADEIGAAGFVGKPFEKKTLVSTVERILRPSALAMDNREFRRP